MGIFIKVQSQGSYSTRLYRRASLSVIFCEDRVMEEFVRRQNIERYERRLYSSTDQKE